jgi:alkylhydroperoxidase family enzyme
MVSLFQVPLYRPNRVHSVRIHRMLQTKLTQTRNSFLLAIRTKTHICPSIRESAICRVAALNRAWFEWEHHAPLLLATEGITEAYIQAVFSAKPGTWQALTKDKENDIDGVIPDEVHALVLEFTDALTLGPEVPPELFERMRDAFGEREIVEIAATIGCYNCVSRFLVALDVGERLGEKGMHTAISHAGGVKPGTEPAPRTYTN